MNTYEIHKIYKHDFNITSLRTIPSENPVTVTVTYIDRVTKNR